MLHRASILRILFCPKVSGSRTSLACKNEVEEILRTDWALPCLEEKSDLSEDFLTLENMRRDKTNVRRFTHCLSLSQRIHIRFGSCNPGPVVRTKDYQAFLKPPFPLYMVIVEALIMYPLSNTFWSPNGVIFIEFTKYPLDGDVTDSPLLLRSLYHEVEGPVIWLWKS